MTNITKKDTNKRKYVSWNLSFTGLLIFLLFKIPLTNIIGNEGNGYYFVSFEIFTIFYIVFGYCFHQITYGLFRKNIRKYSADSRRCMFTLLFIIGLVLSLAGTLLMTITSKWILSYIHMELSIIGLRILSVFLIISTFSGIFRGYFEACGSQIPTAFSMIIEAIVAGTGSIIFTSLLSKYGTKVGNLLFNAKYQPAFGSSGINCGLLIGSIFSLLFLFIVYQFYQRYQKQTKESSGKTVSKKIICMDILKMYFICLLPLLFMHTYRLFNMTIYISALNKQILEENSEINILSVIGSYHGKILVLVGIAILVILSLCGINITKIRKNYNKNSYENCWKYTIDDIKQILYISIPVCALFVVSSEQILTLLYGKANLTEINFLKIESLSIIFIPLSIYLYRIIQKLNLNIALLIIPLCAFAIQCFTMYSLSNSIESRMLSIVIAEVVFWFLIFIMELMIIMKEFKKILAGNR